MAHTANQTSATPRNSVGNSAKVLDEMSRLSKWITYVTLANRCPYRGKITDMLWMTAWLCTEAAMAGCVVPQCAQKVHAPERRPECFTKVEL